MTDWSKVYGGNPNLKAENVEIEFTPEQIMERIRCTQDPIYFMKKYVKIVHVDRGLVPFEMYPFQEDLARSFIDHRFTIAKLPRQVGKSTVTVAFILWSVLFGPMQNIAILANKGSTAKDILAKFQLAYEHIPFWMQQGVRSWNKFSIELENGSKVVAGSTASSATRGNTYNLIFLDEFAFVPHNIAEDFFTSVFPTISSGKTTKVIMVSTPNGMNLFWKIWTDAINKRNPYNPIEAHWSVVPGRDEEWKKQQVAVLGEEKFEQEFGCSFLGSSNTLIAASKLNIMTWNPPIARSGMVDVYQNCLPGHLYIVLVDVGRGQNQDYSALTVVDATQCPYKVVAKYRNKHIDSFMFPTVIHNIATYYNEAHVLIEINDLGKQVSDILHNELEYENIFTTQDMGRAGQKLASGFKKGAKNGLAMSKATKKIGCANLKSLIEDNKLIIEDCEIIQELTTFVSDGQSYSAEPGCNDDLVMTLVLFGWLINQQFFKELTSIDIRKRMLEDKTAQMQENLLPFGISSTTDDAQVEVDDEGNVWYEAPDYLKKEMRFFQDMGYVMDNDDDDTYGGNSL